MPTNRNNNELGKAFAVGTKIEYNGKSYEVIESNSCVDCSIASICSSSSIPDGKTQRRERRAKAIRRRKGRL